MELRRVGRRQRKIGIRDMVNDPVLEKNLTYELGHKLLSEHEVSPLPP